MRLFTTICAFLALSTAATAQYRGIEWSIDGTNPVIDGVARAVVRVYVGYDDPSWQLNAVYGDGANLLSISTTDPLGFYQHIAGGDTSLQINAALYPNFPDLRYDSWVTIGREDSTDNEMLHIGMDYGPWNSGGALQADNGTWFAVPIAFTQCFPDANGQVLIAQFTVTLGETIQGTVHLQGKDGSLDVTTHLDQTFLIDTGVTPGDGFCFGDGSAASCPCFGFGSSGEGCANSGGLGGAILVASGNASFTNDTFQLGVSGLPGAKPGLCVKGSAQLGGGSGNPVGDGLLCTAPQIRSQVIVSDGSGTLSMDNWNGQPFGTYLDAANVGVPTYYQWWYRDPPNTCSGSGFNFTNGWAVTWLP